MESTHGFPEMSTKQYEEGLRHIGLAKKLTIQKWLIVEAHVKKRKERDGKDTEVYLCGVLQPEAVFRRKIARNKTEYLRKRLSRAQIPDLPEGITLKTPPPSPTMGVITSRSSVARSPSPFSPIASINMGPGACHLSQHALASSWARMILNPQSSFYDWAEVPTSKVITMCLQTVSDGHLSFRGYASGRNEQRNSPWGSEHTQHVPSYFHDIQGLTHTSPQTNTISPSQLHFMGTLGSLCPILINSVWDFEEIANPQAIVDWIGMQANKHILKVFFSLNSPAVALMWKKLMHLAAYMKSVDAFKALIEIALQTNSGKFITQNVPSISSAAIHLGSTVLGNSFVQHLLTNEMMSPSDNRPVSKSVILSAAYYVDIGILSMFLHSGGALEVSIEKALIEQLLSLHPQDWIPSGSSRRQRFLNFVDMNGFNLDTPIKSFGPTERVFGELGSDDISFRHDFPFPCLLSDILWLDNEIELYQAIIDKERARTELTLSGLMMAADRGTEELRAYLNERQPCSLVNGSQLLEKGVGLEYCRQISYTAPKQHGNDPIKTLLEAALTLVAGHGKTVAIQAFVQVGVDPSARMLISPSQGHLHPLMRAAAGKYFDAVVQLIELGADLRFDVFGFNLLWAAVWKQRSMFGNTALHLRTISLSPSKRHEQLEVLSYFLRQGLADAYGFNTLTKMLKQRRAELDETIIGMLLQELIKPNDVTTIGKDILRSAIEGGASVKTLLFLLSRGLKFCSHPSERRTKITPQTSAESPPEEGYYFVIEKEQRCHLFSEFLNNGIALDTNILSRLLLYNAPDALIDRVIEAGAVIDSPLTDKSPTTPLQLAASKLRLHVIQQLLIRGATINTPGQPGYVYTALVCAITSNSYGRDNKLDVVQYLIDKGADPNGGGANTELTPLYKAIVRNSMPAFFMLLDAGANIHADTRREVFEPMNDSRQSPLDTAARLGRLDMVDVLLKRGAQSYKQGKTPYDGAIEVAIKRGDYPIAEMIEQFAQQNSCD
ncbi:hypothetical protein F4808DRAFT_459089 [Astrocystis sublimbata]|nr:hypothetical protein F4808DRAFT_459089 [Astrocystis sublimbata]